MARILDAHGNEISTDQYRPRLLASPERQAEIRKYLKKKERDLAKAEWDLLHFVGGATYSENILDEQYHVSDESFRLMHQWRKEFNLAEADNKNTSHDFIGEKCYDLAKMMRLGAPVHLSQNEKKLVLEKEEELFKTGDYGEFISYWNRNKDLRIRSKLPAATRRVLEQDIISSLVNGKNSFGMEWPEVPIAFHQLVHNLSCARRIGLRVPPLESTLIEWWIDNLIDQKGEEELGRMTGYESPIDPEVKLNFYICYTHHLRRILFDDEAV